MYKKERKKEKGKKPHFFTGLRKSLGLWALKYINNQTDSSSVGVLIFFLIHVILSSPCQD